MSVRRLRHLRSRHLVLESLEQKYLLDGIGLSSIPLIGAEPSSIELRSRLIAPAPPDVQFESIRPTPQLDPLGMSLSPDADSRDYWLDFDVSDGLTPGTAASVQLTDTSTSGIAGQITIPGVWLEPVALDGVEFVRLALPEYGFTDVVGAPQLPVIRSVLAVPDGVALTAQITGQPHLLSIADVGIHRPLAPMQASVAKLAGALEAATLDYGLAYQTDQFLPAEGVRITEAGYSAGQRLVMLEIAPISYNPAGDLLSVYDTLTFQVSFSGSKDLAKDLAAVGGTVEQIGLSEPVSGGAASAAVEVGRRLLIVTHNDFASGLSAFVAHKASLGWTVDVANTSVIGATTTAIRDYIRVRYNNAATRPNAVLLVGDTDRIPYFVGLGNDTPDTDLYYGCMDAGDDWRPEIPVGRFSVRNSTQLAAVVAKTIDYETMPSAAWMDEAAFMAGIDSYTISEGTHNYVINAQMNPEGYTSQKLYATTYGATTQDVTNAFNAGIALGVYSGHGAATNWADGPRFLQADVRALTNAGKYPLIASFACVTGSYASYDESFMETWLREPDGGAVAAVGASENSWWTEDDYLEKMLFRAIYDENYTSYGAAWLRAKELYLQHFGVSATHTRSYFEMYNMMGDPTIELRRTELEITSPAQLPPARELQPYEYLLAAANGTGPFGWSLIAGALPEGLQLDGPGGRIFGTPTAYGEFSFTLQVQDASVPPQLQTKAFSLEVGEPWPLTLTIPGSATEGAGLLAGGGTVSIPTPATANLTITLQSDDTSEVAIPSATATILAGQTSVAFDLLIADDAILDGTQVARITASAPGCYDTTASIAADDNETAVLALVLPESAREGDGLLADRATLTVSQAPDVDVVVALASSDTTEVTAPATVTIPAGQTFVTFDLGIQDDSVIDDTQVATITATVTNWTVGIASMAVLDNDGYLALQTPAKVWEGQGLLSNAGTVSIGGTLAVDLVVLLESNDPGELAVPASVTIPAGLTSVPFDLIVQDDAEFDGSHTVVIAATAAGVGVESEGIAVGDNDVHHFAFSPISDPQTANVPFALSVTAKDIQDQTIEVFDGWFDLTAAGDGGAVPLEITPAGQKSVGAAASGLTVYDPADLDSASDAKATLGTYHGYAALSSELAAFAAARPDIARLVSIGRSVQGRELWAMKITDNPDLEENEPEAKYVATMHGDEPVGTEMSLYLINELLGGYGVDPRITSLIDQTEIWILPLMNPDGREAGIRTNAQGYNLNRSFPEGSSTAIGTVFSGPPMDLSGRPPEVVEVMQWSASQSFALSANFHTGALVVNYPYDNDGLGSVDSPSPDDALFEHLAATYASHNPPMLASPYFPGGITNGAAWYAVDGGMQDWDYRYLGTDEVTIELSDTKWPSASLLPTLWNNNRESMLSYLETVHIGASGVVTDAATGSPVFASVAVAGNAQPVFTDPDVGDFHRLLLPGTYDLTFSALGYVSQTVHDVVVADGVETPVDVALVPLAANHRMVDGQWIGEVAVDALATNVVLTAADLLGHTGASSVFDVATGALDHFQWSTVDSPQYAGVPFEVTITAQDAHGYTIKDFNASLNLSASGRAWDDSSVVISEVDAGSLDAAEFTNVSGRDVDVSGWNVAFYDYLAWPNPVSTFTVPDGTIVPAGGVFTLTENGVAPGVYPNFRTGNAVYWTSNTKTAVLLTDDAGQPIDFMSAAGASAAEITSPLTIPDGQWQGAAIPQTTGSNTYRRIGDRDHENAGDWQSGAGSMGTLNAGLTAPFAPDIRWLAVTPATTPALVDGVWRGSVSVAEAAQAVELYADDGKSKLTESNAFDVLARTYATVRGEYVFYDNSAWDGYQAGAGASDDLAIAVDKTALLPSQAATFANYTSYTRGINGVMVDIAGLNPSIPLDTAVDFRFKIGNNNDPDTWSDAPAPSSFAVRPNAGVGGADRVTICWEDGAIANRWLQVTVLATDATQLAGEEVFYFGNAIGEGGNQPGNAIVNATDEILARNFPHSPLNPAAIDDLYDYNRDGLVNGTDQIAARNHQTNPLGALRLIWPPASDAAIAEGIEQPAKGLTGVLADPAWLYEVAQANKTAAGTSTKGNPADDAADRLLATYWA